MQAHRNHEERGKSEEKSPEKRNQKERKKERNEKNEKREVGESNSVASQIYLTLLNEGKTGGVKPVRSNFMFLK